MVNPVAQALTPFLWGRGGSRMTPEQIARERGIAEALGVVDTSPVDHWLQGAARMANAVVGQVKERRADQAEAEGMASASNDFAPIAAGFGLSSPSMDNGQSIPAPGGVQGTMIYK